MVNLGDKVRLSAFGIEMQNPKDKNKVGVITDKMRAGSTDFTVLVKWATSKNEEWMHEHQVKKI